MEFTQVNFCFVNEHCYIFTNIVKCTVDCEIVIDRKNVAISTLYVLCLSQLVGKSVMLCI